MHNYGFSLGFTLGSPILWGYNIFLMLVNIDGELLVHFSMLSSCLIHLHIPLRKMKETNEWLHKLIGKFNIDSQIVDMKRCFNQREAHFGMFVRIVKGRGRHNAWDICCKAQS